MHLPPESRDFHVKRREYLSTAKLWNTKATVGLLSSYFAILKF